jgi:hypothetical protein
LGQRRGHRHDFGRNFVDYLETNGQQMPIELDSKKGSEFGQISARSNTLDTGRTGLAQVDFALYMYHGTRDIVNLLKDSSQNHNHQEQRRDVFSSLINYPSKS